MSIKKRVISGLTSIAMILASSTVSILGELRARASASDNDFNPVLYKADLYSTEGEIPYNTINFYANFDSPSTKLANSANQNLGFQASVAAWETLTFESEKIPGSYVDRVGYYETIVFKALDSYYKSSIVKDTYDNKYIKSSKKLWSVFKNNLKTDSAMTADIIDKSFSALSDSDQEKVMKAFKASFKTTYPKIANIDKVISILSDAIRIGKITENAFSNYCSYVTCYEMDCSMKQFVYDLYKKCDGTANPEMKTALNNINNACQNYEMAYDSTLFDTSIQTFSFVFGKVSDTAFDAVLTSQPLGLGLKIGQQIGKNISNILFSTDELCEQYYKMECLRRFEALLKYTVKYEISNYKNNKTEYNAETMFAGVEVMFINILNSCDMAKEFAEIVYTKGIAGFFYENQKAYEAFSNSVDNIKAYITQQYNDYVLNYWYAILEYDNPEAFAEYNTSTRVAVSGVSFPKKAVNWTTDWLSIENYSATVYPSDAYNKSVTYTSSNNDVVRYANGFPVIYAPGTTVITATTADGGYTDSMTVTVTEADSIYDRSDYIYSASYYIKDNMKLTKDTVFYGDVYVSADIDLNGKTLYIGGNFIHSGGTLKVNGGTLNVTGDYIFKSYKENGSPWRTSGKIIMMYDSDKININGNFDAFASESSYNKSALSGGNALIAGELTVGGDFIMNRDSGTGSLYPFKAYGTHKTIFKGNKVHYIDIYSTEGFLNYIDVSDGAKLTFKNNAHSFVLNDDLTIVGDFKFDSGDLNLKGHTLTIDGNFIHSGGTLKVNEGTLNVTGDYIFKSWRGDESPWRTSGKIIMMYDSDKININGNFDAFASGYSYNDSAYSGGNALIAGELTVGGDFIMNRDSGTGSLYPFKAYGTHKTILNGKAKQNISFYSNTARFNILELTQSKSNYTFSYEPCWNKLIYAEHDHDYSSETTKEPTCTEAGEMKYTCKICDYFYTEPIPANGHKLTETPALAATCTTAGNSAYWTCSECGKHFSDSEGNTEIEKDSWFIKATSHSWKTPTYEWSEDGMTCTATRVCANNSSHKETETVNSTSVVRIAATCTEMGTTRYTAEFENTAFNSQSKDIQDIAAIGHSYVSEVSEPATCTEDGTMTYTCDCGDSYTETIKATGHKYVDTVIAPTATEQGYTHHKCSVCGDEFDDSFVDPIKEEAITLDIILNANDKTMSAENVSISIDGEAALASDNGSAELSLADGAYEITFSAYGFVPRTYTVEVKDGKLTEELTPELNLIGDADGNGVVNTLDIVKLKRHLIKVEPLKGYALDCANTDGNDTLNTLDIVKLKRHLINVEKLW